MLPKRKNFSDIEIDIVNIPTNTFKVDFEKNRVKNLFDGVNALKQAIYKILMTERYKYAIYNWQYGFEIDDLFGMPKGYVKTEIQRRIKEALLQDDRIENVYEFTFLDLKEKGALEVKFFVKSIFGQFNIDWRIDI